MKNSIPDKYRRILVIDDNQSIHKDFKAILDPDERKDDELDQMAAAIFDEDHKTPDRETFHVESAYQGQQGLEMIKKAIRRNQTYAVAFVDMRMPPGWDGLETIRNIWEEDPHIEIVISTAYSDYSWSEIQQQLGQSDQLLILKKPFDAVEVCQLAFTLCQKRHLADQARLKIHEMESIIEERTAHLKQTNQKLQNEIEAHKQAEEALHNNQRSLLSLNQALLSGVEEGNWTGASARILSNALKQTQSEYGFVGVMVEDQLRVIAHEGIKWDKVKGREFFDSAVEAYKKNGYLPFTNFDTLFGQVIKTKKPYLSNSPDTDRFSKGRPEGHPPMHSFLGVPIHTGKALIGMVAVANRPGGYTEQEVRELGSLTQILSTLYEKYVSEEERKRAEEALRKSEDKYRRLLESASYANIIVNNKGKIDLVNTACEKLFGYSRSELIGKPVEIFVPERFRKTHPQNRDTYFTAPTSRMMGAGRDLFAIRKDGSEFPAEIGLSPLETEEGMVVSCAIIDLTTRKEAEEAIRKQKSLEEAVQAMQQVIGVVSHELRTPLAALRATSEFLLNPQAKESEDFDIFLKSIHSEVIHMAETVNNTLEAARLNSGSARWNWTTVSLQSACDDALNVIRPLIDHDKITLTHSVEPKSLEMCGDTDAIRRLIINLVTNAAKHTDRGSIRIHIEQDLRQDQRFIKLEVKDTGDGIPQEIIKKLGQAFALNAGMVGGDYVKGSGLGLAICKGIAAAHGGSITVDSKPEKGATFTVMLKADLAEPEKIKSDTPITQEVTP